jgi:hypothetical protein
MDKRLSTQDYMEILKKKRQDGTYDYADRVFYKGKVMLKCPPGATKLGNTCVPSAAATAKGAGPGKTWQKDLGGINPQQVQQLGVAKTSKDIKKAREKNG